MSPSKKASKKQQAEKPAKARKLTQNASVGSSRPSAANANTTPPAKAENASTGQPEARKTSTRITILRILALAGVIGITYFIFSIRNQIDEFKNFGYPGVFLIALLANATILVPAPGAAVVYAMGAVKDLNPLMIGLAAGTGGAIGELSGYLAGFSGQAVIERTDIYERTKPWIDKYGGWAILFLSAIPNPFFDAAGIAAGIAKMPLKTFLIFLWIGQLIKMTLFAYAGRLSLDWLTQFFN